MEVLDGLAPSKRHLFKERDAARREHSRLADAHAVLTRMADDVVGLGTPRRDEIAERTASPAKGSRAVNFPYRPLDDDELAAGALPARYVWLSAPCLAVLIAVALLGAQAYVLATTRDAPAAPAALAALLAPAASPVPAPPAPPAEARRLAALDGAAAPPSLRWPCLNGPAAWLATLAVAAALLAALAVARTRAGRAGRAPKMPDAPLLPPPGCAPDRPPPNGAV
jgi:hypothetical protein